jgi:hypothetical protein
VANGTRKYRTRKSDRMGSQRESLRCDGSGISGFFSRFGRSGHGQWSTASRACACGKPALRVWKDAGYCKEHAPEKV